MLDSTLYEIKLRAPEEIQNIMSGKAGQQQHRTLLRVRNTMRTASRTGYKSSMFSSSDGLPPARPHLLTVSQPPHSVPLDGSQQFKYMNSPGEHF